MPIYEYFCGHCGSTTTVFKASYRNKRKREECEECGELATSVLSTFNTSPSIFVPLSGVDDTDDLTVGKLVANKGMPAEHKRNVRERIDRYNKGIEKHKERKRALGFETDAKGKPF